MKAERVVEEIKKELKKDIDECIVCDPKKTPCIVCMTMARVLGSILGLEARRDYV